MSKFKVIIAGGRDFDDYEMLRDKCNHLFQRFLEYPFLERDNHLQIVSGGAKGADQMGEIYRMHIGADLRVFKADWDNLHVEPCLIRVNSLKQEYNALAGHNRNKQMGEYADALIAFHDGRSKGTQDMINLMKRLKKSVRVVKYEL